MQDNWEDDDEDEKKDEEKVETPVKTKPKKTLEQKIAEKERLKAEEAERKRKEQEEDMANMTPEERIAEKLRLQKLQEEADLKTALDTLGLGPSSIGIDAMTPNTKEEFTEFAEAISKKIFQFKNSDEYPTFVDDLVRNLCAGCEYFSFNILR